MNPPLILRRNGKVGKPVLPKARDSHVLMCDVKKGELFFISPRYESVVRICFVKTAPNVASVSSIDSECIFHQFFPDHFPVYRS